MFICGVYSKLLVFRLESLLFGVEMIFWWSSPLNKTLIYI